MTADVLYEQHTSSSERHGDAVADTDLYPPGDDEDALLSWCMMVPEQTARLHSDELDARCTLSGAQLAVAHVREGRRRLSEVGFAI